MASASNPNPFTGSFSSLADETIKKWKIPGLAFTVVHSDDTFSHACGYADIEAATPVDAERTLFAVGSTTKAQLCAAWAIYMDSQSNKSRPKSEQITWKTPLTDIIHDDFVLPDTVHTREITLEDLVCHRSGIASNEPYYGWEKTQTVKDVTRNLRHLPLKSPVRSEWSYCNVGYAVATHALETVTGTELTTYLREQIWKPLGMDGTFGGIKDVEEAGKKDSLATGYTYSSHTVDEDWGKGTFESNYPQDLSPVSGAGYIISTVTSFAKWLRCLLAKTSPFSSDIVQQLLTPRSSMPWKPLSFKPLEGGHVQYAPGWIVGILHGHKVVYHAGSCIGFGALVMVVPDLQWAGVMLGNEGFVGIRVASLMFELFETSLGIPPDKRKAFKEVDDSIPERYKVFFPPRSTRIKNLFPNAPESPTIAHTLTLAAYAGTYHHPGYGNLNLDLTDDGSSLKCEVTDRTWLKSFAIIHINAEHWLFEEKGGFLEMCKAESKVGVDGKVEGFRIAMEASMPETFVWFARV